MLVAPPKGHHRHRRTCALPSLQARVLPILGPAAFAMRGPGGMRKSRLQHLPGRGGGLCHVSLHNAGAAEQHLCSLSTAAGPP